MRPIYRLSPLFYVLATVLPRLAMAEPGVVCQQPIEVFLTDPDGTPLDRAVDIRLNFHLDGAAAPSECRQFNDVAVIDGWVRLDVDSCSLDPGGPCGTASINDLVEDAASTGSEIEVAMVVDGENISPRLPLGATAYAAYANTAGRALFADECGSLDGFDATDFIRRGEAIDAATLDGFDSLDFLFAGEAIDADTLGGMTLAEILALVGEGGGGESPVGTRLTETFESFDVPLTASTTTVTIDKEVPIEGIIESVVVHLDITHPVTAEISRARLYSPSGTSIDLHTSRAGVNIDCSYPTTCTCSGATCTEAFIGEQAQGLWSLELRDAVAGNPIIVTRFALEIRYRNPGVIADLPATFTVGGQPVQINTLGGTGELGDLVVLPGEVHPLMPFVPYHYRNIVVHAGGTLGTLYDGEYRLFASGDVVFAGTIDLTGRGFPGGDGGSMPVNAVAAGGSGGQGGGGLYIEAGGAVVVRDSATITSRGTEGQPGGAGASIDSDLTGTYAGRAGAFGRSSADVESEGGQGGVGNSGGEGGSTCRRWSSFISDPAFASASANSIGIALFARDLRGCGGGGGGGGGFTNSGPRGGGGGGGAGGGGGSVVLRAGRTVTLDGSIDVSGGAGGSAGAGYNSGQAGLPGARGSLGTILAVDSSGLRACIAGACDYPESVVPPGAVSRRVSSATRTYSTSAYTAVSSTEVTASLWQSATGVDRGAECGDRCPVTADWFATLAFANHLSAANGFQPCFLLSPPSCADEISDWSTGVSTCTGAAFEGLSCNGYRPPTSAEWEIMYRGETSSTSGTYLGNVVSADAICSPDPTADLLGWYCSNSAGGVREVGRHAPTRDGIYDLFGNVAEWTLDRGLNIGEGIDRIYFDASGGRTSGRVACGLDFNALARDANNPCRESVRADSLQGIRLVRTLP